MLLAQITLIYEGRHTLENGSPQLETLERTLTCEVRQNFSQYYYRQNNRIMRNSKNISIPLALTYDVIRNGVKYSLRKARLNETIYQVKEILTDRKSSLKMILDLEELTQ